MMRAVIGIDPGLHNGIAVLADGCMVELATLPIAQVLKRLDHLRGDYDILRIGVEYPRTKQLWRSRRQPLHGGADAQRIIDAQMITAHNVGMSCARMIDAYSLVCDYLGYGSIAVKVAPGERIDAQTFGRLTGWSGRSNEHERAAGMIAHCLWSMLP